MGVGTVLNTRGMLRVYLLSGLAILFLAGFEVAGFYALVTGPAAAFYMGVLGGLLTEKHLKKRLGLDLPPSQSARAGLDPNDETEGKTE